MKRILVLAVMCLMALSMQAQRCAVFEFKVQEGISEEDVEGVSFVFRSNFHPSGYTVIEREQVERTIKDMGFKPSKITQEQMISVGRKLDASFIVVGIMTKSMDEYNVALNAIKVETGISEASDGASFERSAYRDNVRMAALRLAEKIVPTGSVVISQPIVSQPATKPAPTGYVNLGLPSGTLWKDRNEAGRYTYDEAVERFGLKLPSKDQFDELKAKCKWIWIGKSYKVIGPNGNAITMPAEGIKQCDGTIDNMGSNGNYWTSESKNAKKAYQFFFRSSKQKSSSIERCTAQSVRLVQE